jgi:hypothetical protein
MGIESNTQCFRPTRRQFVRSLGAVPLAAAWGASVRADNAASSQELGASGTSNIDFEKKLKQMRFDAYQHPAVEVAKGFRPVGGSLADFAVGHHAGRDHFFYIERRLQEGTPFFPGHEIYFGHASTPDLVTWEVHDPVLLIRPGTWEEAHVWAPVILPHEGEYLMAYTGLNRHLAQDIGLASSKDMLEWKRWESNPISPCKGASWAAWWPDEICSCRDPHLLRHEGRIYMVYTANTREGATCLAMCSTADLKQWRDHGTILVGPSTGYEPKLWGGHPQGSLESANLSYRAGRWVLIVNASIRGKGGGCWIDQGERMDKFSYDRLRPFWPGAGCIEVVRDRGNRSLLAGIADGGRLRFGVVDWSAAEPAARFVETAEELREWL